jgi:DNA polymerase-1
MVQKLKSTYVDALPLLINAKTGRLHTSFNQTVAATGRLSSTAPNLQNIPIKTEQGREIRKSFVPRGEGYTLISADYSQVELRIIAHLSGDEGMIEAFSQKQDIHAATAAKIYGIELADVTSDMRRNAKSVNFGIIYGMSAFGLSEQLQIPRAEAGEIIKQYFIKYPRVKEYMDLSIERARENGYVETIMGRRRNLPDINSTNATVRGYAERNAINAPIQGTAADIIKLAMINIHADLKRLNTKSKMVLQVHDELVFDVHVDELDMLKPLIHDRMMNAVSLTVPLEVEVGVGQNWLEAH